MAEDASRPFLNQGRLIAPGNPGNVGTGSSVTLSADGNTAVSCGYLANTAWVFTRVTNDRGAQTWACQATLKPTDAIGSPSFGFSAAISYDGDVIIIGGAVDNSSTGAAWVFARSNTGWTQKAKIIGPNPSAGFGSSVALSWDGSTALIGAPGANDASGGSAWFYFVDDDGNWVQGARLQGSNRALNQFGNSVALSADADYALVGSVGDSLAALFSYSEQSGAWQRIRVVPAPSGLQQFGVSVAMNADGSCWVVGSVTTGALFFGPNGYQLVVSPDASRLDFGSGVAMSADGQTAWLADWDNNTGGVAWVYTAGDDGVWREGQRLSGTDGGFADYRAWVNLALSADGQTGLIGSAGNNSSMEETWVFDCHDESSPISHVFVLMLENHSFDNIFAFSGIQGITSDAPGKTNSYVLKDRAYTVAVASNAPEHMPTDPGHEFADVVEQLCGQGTKYANGATYPPATMAMSGFAANYATSTTEIHHIGNPRPPTDDEVPNVMKCFNTPQQLPVIHALASNFVVCDHWFASVPGPTFPNRLFLHGGSSAGLADSPPSTSLGAWSSVKGFTFQHGTVFDALKKLGVNWRIYTDHAGLPVGWLPPVCSLKGVSFMYDTTRYGVFADDVKSPSYPRGYTFIEPSYGNVVTQSFVGGSSQHPMDGMYAGEMLIKTTYEAIRASPHWNSSMLVILYDEHGGFYDSMPPVPMTRPNDAPTYAAATQFDFATSGVRVPAVIVSPLVQPGVDHQTYDHTSVLALLGELFGVPALTERVKSANGLKHLLTLSSPRDTPASLPDPPPPPAAMAARATAAAALGPSGSESAPLHPEGAVHGFLGTMLKADVELRGAQPAPKAVRNSRRKLARVTNRGSAEAFARRIAQRAERARDARAAARGR